jgi:ATP-dependent helicase/nuclease subunit B
MPKAGSISSMAIRREFLDWKQPALAAAAEVLARRYAKGGTLDLANAIVVVPGGRAGRRLLELLVTKAEEGKQLLTPPTIVTPEAFPELLYEAKWPFADVLTQQLAWASALRSAPRELMAEFLPYPPDASDTSRWLAIGETLRRLHIELAADGLDCGKVLEGADAVEGFLEHDRWQTLKKLQRRYLDVLDRLELWDVQTARLVAVERREIATEKDVVLIGAVDLNQTQRQMLDLIADQVTALVIAPPDLADRFDEHGCLIPTKWAEAELPLTDGQIERVDGPADQAEAVTRWLASLGGKYRADQITIGMADERLVPHVERQIAQCGLSGRWAIGKQLAETGPYRLLQVAADYATRRRFRDLAALVRHADVWEKVQRSEVRGQKSEASERQQSEDFLTVLDEFAQDRLPAQLDPERLANEKEKKENSAFVLDIYAAVEKLIAPLDSKPRALADWTEALRQVLAAVYGSKELKREQDADRYLAMALSQIAEALDGIANVPQELQPVVDARQACRMVLAGLANAGIPPTSAAESIEMLGWLELPLDDAPATIVTTFNEGLVPSSANADAYLPNRLREKLGLMHNDRRLARDAYATALIAASRQELKLIVARRDSQGNPLTPSRLLFLTTPDKLVERACKFFGELPPQAPRRRLLPSGPTSPPPRLVPPLPEKPKQELTALSVTKFRDYIACPYRFYLRHIARLDTITDEADELDGGGFGGLVHQVLEQFGRGEESKTVRSEVNPQKIAEYLQDKLTHIAFARFGKQSARPAVLVQVEQIRLRLAAFAQWQAGRNRDGWRIVFSEESEVRASLEASWPVDGRPFTLQGRIDRIDYHDTLRKLSIVDYKTADRGDDPMRTHLRKDEWTDLQLPLYRHLIPAAKLPPDVAADAEVELGYIVLPLDLESAGLLLANWNDDLLKSADEKAREIVRNIRQGVFWPRTAPPPDFFEDVAAICQDRSIQGNQDEEAA